MKYSFALTLAAAGSMVAAQHQHHHRHHHNNKREVVVVDGPTITEYMLDGKVIDSKDACAGIKDGSFVFNDPKPDVDPCQQTYTPTVAPAEFIETSSSTSSTTSTTSSSSSTTTTTTTTTQNAPTTTSTTTQAATSTGSSSSSTGTGLDTPFPDGKIDCSTFPSEYGPISVDYLGLGGWIGVQNLNWLDGVLGKIDTVVKGGGCGEGNMCSYACPPGYQKSQWPKQQGSSGESIGGIQCKGGKLYLTNKELSHKLCIPGVGDVEAQNTIGQHVAVCRTDYPGTEGETVPLSLNNGETKELTCPNGATYYNWEGKTTSAQYYVNPAGVSTEKGCQWGDGKGNTGNRAPINLGVGENNGKWLSIFQNSPTTQEKLDFNIKIEGDNLSGSCKYEDGLFISETGTSQKGCTVQAMSGKAVFKFYK